MKKYLPTLVALLLLAGLGVYVGLFESKPESEKQERAYKVKQEDIVSFKLNDRTKGLALTCEKQEDGSWLITAPSKLIAEDDAVDAVTRQLAEPQLERRLEAESDLSPFGLDKPLFHASFTLKNGKSHALLLGAKNPTGSSYFLMKEGGDALFTIAAYSADGLMKTVHELRSKTPLKFKPEEADKLVLERTGADTVEFAREGEAWNMTRPVRARADRFAIDGLLSDLGSLKASEVLEEPDAYSRYKLDQPVARVSVFTGTGTGHRLVLSRPKKGEPLAYASSSRLPFTLKLTTDRIIDQVTKEVEDYRERILLQTDRNDLSHVSVKMGDLDIMCTKGRNDKWTVTKPEGRDIGTEFDDMIFEVVYVRAEEFIDENPRDRGRYGLNTPGAEVILTGQKNKEPFSFRYHLGKRSGDKVYLSMHEHPAVYAVRQELIEKVERFADKIRAGDTVTGERKPEEEN